MALALKKYLKFFQINTSKSFCSQMKIENVMVIGAGLMGSGIAQVCASSKFNVLLADTSTTALSTAKEAISKSLKKLASKEHAGDQEKIGAVVGEILARISFCSDALGSAGKADLIIEAVLEKLDVKQRLFAALHKVSSQNAILASNTSSLSISDIALAVSNQSRFAGLHFFNPVPLMKLVEIVSTKSLDERVISSLESFVKVLKKFPVHCKDTPGFITNRLLVPYLLQAIEMLERGDASMRDIDVAMKFGAGYPMGPFELCDLIGLDTIQFILEGWCSKHGDHKEFKIPLLLERLVNEGKVGKKANHGFYNYPGPSSAKS